MVDGHINTERVSDDYSSYDSTSAKSRDVLPHCRSPVSKSDNLKKDDRACMQSCHGCLGSNLVSGMSQDQIVCLEVGQPVSKSDILAH